MKVHTYSLYIFFIRSNYDYINLTAAMVEDFGNLSLIDLSQSFFYCNDGVNWFMSMSWNTTGELVIEGFFSGYGYYCKDENNVVKSFASFNVS
jgi:hypothetical protein